MGANSSSPELLGSPKDHGSPEVDPTSPDSLGSRAESPLTQRSLPAPLGGVLSQLGFRLVDLHSQGFVRGNPSRVPSVRPRMCVYVCVCVRARPSSHECLSPGVLAAHRLLNVRNLCALWLELVGVLRQLWDARALEPSVTGRGFRVRVARSPGLNSPRV